MASDRLCPAPVIIKASGESKILRVFLLNPHMVEVVRKLSLSLL